MSSPAPSPTPERIRVPERTLVTVATYNEIENLPTLVDEIFQVAPDADLLVVDDGSPDGTGQWCDQRALQDPRVHCLHRSGKLGLGSALVACMKYGVEQNYDYVLNMDADYSHHPKYIPALRAGMNPAGETPVDVMIGSRYVAGGAIEGWPLKRHLMSRAVNLYARTFLGLKSKDCSGGFRCYRVSRLRAVDFDQLLSQGYSFQEEILWYLKRAGGRMAETPITFVDRVRGSSKIRLSDASGAVRVIFKLGVRNLLGR